MMLESEWITIVPRHKQHITYILFFVNGVGVQLNPFLRENLMIKVNVGHSVALSIQYLDQNGNPMITPPTPDPSPPILWMSAKVAGTITQSGAAATYKATAPGNDSVEVQVQIGGALFAASLAIEVDAVPQVFTSIAIGAVVS